ncbi:MAG: chemotaxis-specific protein-glutamate methyltransferase CheB [Betaproteobacteria bacterium]|nr:chemotaxis-specific protein-glutamate methyltransferase CheB [Betaproteobacteria bacterium]
MIKLLIVDDSALMRRQLTQLFQSQGDFDVRQARNGQDAIEQNLSFEPDVVTLDINMPEIDGITALSLMMAQRPVPVIMVSSLTEKGALATFEALNLGAVDYVAKPGGTISLSLDQISKDMVTKVRAAARSKPRGSSVSPSGSAGTLRQRMDADRKATQALAVSKSVAQQEGIVLIGVSTGGPRSLEDVLPLFPEDFPLPVLVAQHMPASFTAPFAARLNAACPMHVLEADHPMPVERGKIYVGKGGADMVLTKRANKLTVMPKPESPEHMWHPSVDVLAQTALEHVAPRNIIAALLTGMGYDGAAGFAEIKKRGGRTIAESEDTAVVYGMPKELVQRQGATVVLPLNKVAAQVKTWVARA